MFLWKSLLHTGAVVFWDFLILSINMGYLTVDLTINHWVLQFWAISGWPLRNVLKIIFNPQSYPQGCHKHNISTKKLNDSNLTRILDPKIYLFKVLGHCWMNWDDILLTILNLPYCTLNNLNWFWNLNFGEYWYKYEYFVPSKIFLGSFWMRKWEFYLVDTFLHETCT